MEQLIVVKTLEQLRELEKYIEEGPEYVAFDTETTGVEKESQIIGFSLCADIEIAYYVVLSYWSPEEKRLIDCETRMEVKNFISKLVGKNLIMQNSPFDCAMVLNNFGIDLMPSVHTDTMIMGHLLNENRSNGLKERGVELFGEDARREQELMKASVYKNGGVLTKDLYELYKADVDLMAHYGAKDAILTMKLFQCDIPQLFDEGLDKFFYEDESMPLLKGPTYQMNNTGLRVDPEKLQKLRCSLEADCLDAKAFIYKEIAPLIADKYPGKSKATTFNIGSSKQLAWLVFVEMGEPFNTLTKSGKELCKAMDLKIPYTVGAKREFLQILKENKDRVYAPSCYNYKTKKTSRPKKVGDAWNYLSCGAPTLSKLAPKYKWIKRFLEYAKNLKLLNTYVEGIQAKMKYNVIRPSFLQHGTTSGRYSSKRPNFQNLPRDDKRIKACIVSRPGNVFVGADYSQLEPRVFAAHSGDERLLKCFKDKEDFYSVVGAEIFDKYDCSLKKGDKDFFGDKYPRERQQAKVIALAAPYGQTPAKLAPSLDVTMDKAQEIINNYFEKWPKVKKMQYNAHNQVKMHGIVYNKFGRPRRIPKALELPAIYGKAKHEALPYEARTLLNLAVNHEIQSTGASIVNRAAIRLCEEIKKIDPYARLVLQVHDSLIVECKEEYGEAIAKVMQECMENTVFLEGVDLVAEPKIGRDLSEV